MDKNIISISGDLGSGKTVISVILCDALGYESYSTGLLHREIATEKGMTILEMNRFSEQNDQIDKIIDDRTKKYGESMDCFVFDSRMAWYFVPKSFKVYLFVDEEISAERIQKDGSRKSENYTNFLEAKKSIQARRESEKNRFKNLYGVEIYLFHHYDIVIDTSFSTPDQVAQIILSSFKERRKFLNASSFTFFSHAPLLEKIIKEDLRDSFALQKIYNSFTTHPPYGQNLTSYDVVY